MKELIEDVKKNKLRIIVVYRLDRITRSLKDLANLMELLDRYNVKLKSISEELDITSLSGRAMIQMLGVFAEFERGSIAERVAMGREQRAKEGYYTAPGRMFGYNYDKDNQIYTINEDEALIVKEMFELHRSGKGIDAITKICNEKGYKTSTGGDFNRHFVKRAIVNGWYYCGKLKFTKKNGEHFIVDAINIPKPILTEEEFMQSYKIYGAKALDQAKKHSDDVYVFKGKLRCAYCGILLTSNTSAHRTNKEAPDKVYRYYRCYRKREGRCENKYWLSTLADSAFYDFVNRFGSAPIESDLELSLEQRDNLLNNKKVFEEKIEKELERKRKLQLLLLDDTFSKDEFLDLSKEIDNNIDIYKNEIATLDSGLNSLNDIKRLELEKKIANNIATSWPKLNNMQKKEFLNVFVKNIYISREGITKVEFIV